MGDPRCRRLALRCGYAGDDRPGAQGRGAAARRGRPFQGGGPELSKLLQSFSAVAQTAALQGSDANELDWVAIAAFAEDDGLKIEGDAKSTTGGSLLGPAYASKLISGVPADALAFVSYHGGNASDPLSQLRQSPSFNRGLRQFEQELGVPLDTVLALFKHETAFYVRHGPGLPEFSLVLETPDMESALMTIVRLSVRLAKLTSARPGIEHENGLDVETLDFGPVTLRWSGFDGRMLLTTSPTGIADYRSGGGTKLPPELEPNLKPLMSFIAYTGSDGDLTTFSAFLEIK